MSPITATIPEMDDCKVLTRLKAFLVDQGAAATLQHVCRDRKGNPIDLRQWFTEQSDSSSAGDNADAGTLIQVRAREWIGGSTNPHKNPLWIMGGDVVTAATGVVQVELDPCVVERAGIYSLEFAAINERGQPYFVDRAILSVDRSMFAGTASRNYKDTGPPTIQEIRMRLMDSAANENLLLDDVEFKDEQILMAIAAPVRHWNEIPPPIRKFNTNDFPYREAWISGVLGQLHMLAANHYRRNTFRSATGATSDKDKEREYMAEGFRLWEEYKAWCQTEKVACNLRLFAGANGSIYGRRG